MTKTDYAYYQGDELLAVGSAAELARQFGVQQKTIWFYATAAHQRRMDKAKRPSGRRRYVVKIED